LANKETQKKLTPMDIHDVEFKKRGLSGYDRHAVDQFLDQIVDDYGDTLDQTVDLKNEILQLKQNQSEAQQQIDSLNKQVADYQRVQRAAQETIAQAQVRARQIIDEATQNANDQIAQAKVDIDYQKQQLQTIKADYERVKEEAASYRSYIQKLLQQAIDNLNDEQWQKALDKYFGTERFYPQDGGEPLTLTSADEDVDDEDDEVDNDNPDEVNFGEDIDNDEPHPMEGDSSNNTTIDVHDNDLGANSFIFPDDYKNHN
jgi:cell division initiation protein